MNNINFNSGVKEFEVNGRHTLSFNPSDPNVYERYLQATDKIEQLEKEYSQAASEIKCGIDERGFPIEGASILKLMRKLDLQVKQELGVIFGEHNDFETIFGGVNIMAKTQTGERVITNFFSAMQPIMEQGAADYTAQKESEAKGNRAARRATK